MAHVDQGRRNDTPPTARPTASILAVDDDPVMLRLLATALGRAGYRSINAESGERALAILESGERVDAIITDLAMPGMPGLEFMRHVRERDPDLPILVITGAPAMDTAIGSIDIGVFRYLTKPITPAEIVRAASDAVHARALAQVRRAAYTHVINTSHTEPTRDALVRALDSSWLAAQPIVDIGTQKVVAYEALLRTKSSELPHPGAVFSAAESLDLVATVGRTVRRHAAKLAENIPDGTLLFLNLHPLELLDDALFQVAAPLTRHAGKIVLEMTERTSLERIPDARSRVAALKELGFRIALDDMGAGYAGLTSFAMLEPQYVKIDLGLVRNVDSEPIKQTLIRTIVRLAQDLAIDVIAEGVETRAEAETLHGIGCSLLQGYFFARPGMPFVDVSW
ncbi:MAG: Response regulator of zinc sigma-54-dependent two-component system [Myxococcaceae bacterium]|nr:Response regulator of zinc sigma-54-dependent two-component system [Myxococcaceae bacterium]